ncbi:hypothetical protein [Papillibacter cinnamivorans]|uniref:Uncharacterized protein n=1 Tax=Papillibacter cinnamivorans DSM 12816 TaxID=1122930 RepID=A0A1W2A5N8_9FIRM|nr:hypothetical protein [Papillibacter cinnamivorans]SMC56049.1 hypothetical protein SAMN02745168_1530 [Papillibacter cinnamivorans DSM 12816]
MSKIIMGVKLKERMKNASEFQALLSRYGCSISTRLGLHSTGADACSPDGLIILEFLNGAQSEAAAFEKEALALGEVEIQKMVF